jgi:hypothetical protein
VRVTAETAQTIPVCRDTHPVEAWLKTTTMD